MSYDLFLIRQSGEHQATAKPLMFHLAVLGLLPMPSLPFLEPNRCDMERDNRNYYTTVSFG